MENIFLSYNRQSESAAKRLASDLEALGHTVWFDQELSGGQVWWDQILSTVRDCDLFIFLLDPKSLVSTACKREYGYAADLGKPILPILVSGEVSTTLLPPALSKIQFVDYREQDRDAAFRLARAVGAIPPPGPLPDPLPAPPEVPVSYLGSLTEQVESSSMLSFEEQSALSVELKNCLRDPETTQDTLTLLKRLRRRRDLFATIAEELDELIESVEKENAVEQPYVVRSSSTSAGSEIEAEEDYQRQYEKISAKSFNDGDVRPLATNPLIHEVKKWLTGRRERGQSEKVHVKPSHQGASSRQQVEKPFIHGVKKWLKRIIFGLLWLVGGFFLVVFSIVFFEENNIRFVAGGAEENGVIFGLFLNVVIIVLLFWRHRKKMRAA